MANVAAPWSVPPIDEQLSLKTASTQSTWRLIQDLSSPDSIATRRASTTISYWSSYIRLGLLVLAGESLATLCYFLATPNGPHRAALIALTSSTTVVAVATTQATNFVAERSWRSRFSLAWTLLCGAMLAIACYFDGGIDSPLVYLLVLPIVSAALGLSVNAVIVCGFATTGELLFELVTDPVVHRSPADVAMLATTTAGLVVFAVGFATYRTRREVGQRLLEDELEYRSKTDSLTGCLNHSAFYARLDGEINRALRNDEPLCLLMIDLDYFKVFNDAHGHVAGDEALMAVAKVLRQVSRSYDVIGRLGGDEFAIILPNTSMREAREMCSRLLETRVGPSGLQVSTSIGCALLDPGDPGAKRLIREADAALYQAKVNGRARAESAKPAQTRPYLTTRFSHPGSSADADVHEIHAQISDRIAAERLAILDAFEASSSIGLGFVDRNLRMVYTNPTLATLHNGIAADDRGRLVEEVVPELWPYLESIYKVVLDTGTAVCGTEFSSKSDDKAETRYWQADHYPVTVENEIIGVGVVVVDVSEHKQLEAQQKILMQSIAATLSDAIEMRDPYTAGHQSRVAALAVDIARELGLGDEEIDQIELAARVHDVGKIVVPAEILAKPGRLSTEEMSLVRSHSKAGSEMLRHSHLPQHVCDMVLQHHERLDGSGYPNGLRGAEALLGSRIIAVADVFDAMYCNRPYRPALELDAAINELREGSGLRYDSEVVDALLRSIAARSTTVTA